MDFVIEPLPADAIDLLRPLWLELVDHHLRDAPHLAVLGEARTPEDSWRLRREQYLQWLAVPRAAVLGARHGERLLGYAMIRTIAAPGTWQWGDETGILETLVVGRDARGTGVGRALLTATREHLAGWGAGVVKISVVAGNEGALRFYRREGAADFLQTLIMPVRPAEPAAGDPAD